MTPVLQVFLLVDLFARVEVSEDALDVVARRHLADEFDQRGRALIGQWKLYPAGFQT